VTHPALLKHVSISCDRSKARGGEHLHAAEPSSRPALLPVGLSTGAREIDANKRYPEHMQRSVQLGFCRVAYIARLLRALKLIIEVHGILEYSRVVLRLIVCEDEQTIGVPDISGPPPPPYTVLLGRYGVARQ